MPTTKPARWIIWVVRRRYWLLACAASLFVAATWFGGAPALDRSIENMFAQDDPILVPYRRLQRTFGQHEIVMAAYADDQLRTPAGIDRVRELSNKLRQVPGVTATVSLADPPGAADFDDNRRGALFREMFAGYTHNAEYDAAGVICVVERPADGQSSRSETLAALHGIIADYPSGVLVGEPVLVKEAFDLLEADGRRLNVWCTILVLAAILACFRRVRWLLLPLAVVQLALAMTNATLAIGRWDLSMVSSMLSAIVTVVGVATVVHVIVHFLDERQLGRPRRRALVNTLRELAIPVTVAVLTDVAGFAALMVSRVGPVHDFGLMMALGSFLVLPCTLLLAPALVWVADDRESVAAHARGEARMDRWLDQLLRWSCGHVRWIVVGAAALAVAAVAGSSRLEIETDFTKNFRADSSIVEAYKFVETRFGGAGVWDLLLPAPNIPDAKSLLSVLQLEQELKSQSATGGQAALSKAISLADAIAAGFGGTKQLERGGAFGVRVAVGALRARMFDFVNAIYRADPADGRQWMRVLLRSPEQLPAIEKARLIHEVQTAAQARFPEAEVTGYYVLLTRLIDSVLADQWKSFAVAAVLVLAMMLVTIRDVRLTIATVAPNLLPSLVLFGAMGWLGLRMNMGAAMIAAVSVGLSVDGSMHYTMHYQRERRRGLSCDAALSSAQQSIGRAAVFAALALIAGFGTLCVSEFIPTIYFGALTGLSMLGGLVGNVVALPALIRTLDSNAAVS